MSRVCSRNPFTGAVVFEADDEGATSVAAAVFFLYTSASANEIRVV
ncbi:hypothetical protein BH23ACT7_BH23ACT7_24260 [soil metagenome]